MSSCLQSIGYGSDCLNAGVPNGTKLIGGTIKALKRRRRSEESSIGSNETEFEYIFPLQEQLHTLTSKRAVCLISHG